jgi:hypothetical protein
MSPLFTSYMNDEDIRELMTDYELDPDAAERAAELIEERFDEDDALELATQL